MSVTGILQKNHEHFKNLQYTFNISHAN